MSAELCYLSATEALARFRDRSLSPVELLEAIIARAEEVEPTVNALCHERYEEACEEARAAEARYAAFSRGSGPEPRPLEGIPLAVKEEEPIAGQPWPQGSLIHRDLVAGHTSALARRILDAGAIVHARTTAPEFSCAGFTHSRLYGVTRNPWNPRFAAGGSSGGAAAALACGTTTLASGSDIGGSIRIPAAFCGVVGFKPSYGRVPVDPPWNLDAYCHSGPLARMVADCALFQNVIAGPDSSDIATLRPKLELPTNPGGVEGMRIALSVDLASWPIDPEIRQNTLRSAGDLRAAGAIVEEVEVWVPREKVIRATAIHYRFGFADFISHALTGHEDEATDYALAFAPKMAELAGDATLADGLLLEAEIYAPIGALLDEYDALICPTVATRGLVAGDGYVGHGLEVGGEQLELYFDAFLTPLFNVLSRCPVLNVPSGFAANGVPTGLQIVGRTYDDLTPFRIGAALEAARPWLDAHERRPQALSEAPE